MMDPHWKCPGCKWCTVYARVDELKHEGHYGPGPYIRCVNCKRTYFMPETDRIPNWMLQSLLSSFAPKEDGTERYVLGNVKHSDIYKALKELEQKRTTSEQFNDVTGDYGGHGLAVEIRNDGKVFWVNDAVKCLLRVCAIKGPIAIRDARPQGDTAAEREPEQM